MNDSLDWNQERFFECAKYLQSLAKGYRIEGVYDHSNGLVGDLFEIVFVNMLGFKSRQERLMLENWTRFYEENKDNPKAVDLQVVHIQASIHLRNGLSRCPEQIKKFVHVLLITLAAMPEYKDMTKVVTFACRNDPVQFGKMLFSLFTPLEKLVLSLFSKTLGSSEIQKKRSELCFLCPLADGKNVGHDFDDPVFAEHIE